MGIWTAKAVNPRKDGNFYKVDIEYYEDGQFSFSEPASTSQEQGTDWLGTIAKRRIADLTGLANMPGKISAGDITLPADPVADAARSAWLDDFGNAQRGKILVDLGVIPANNAKYVALLARLKSNFKPEYTGLI